MDRVTATSPNWMVESESHGPEKTLEVEKTGQQVEIKEQPRPEHQLSANSSLKEQVIDKKDEEVLGEAEAGLAGVVPSTADQLSHEGSEISVEKNLFMTDDGETYVENDKTSNKHQDIEKIEQVKTPVKEILKEENIASLAEENKKIIEESNQETLLKAETESQNDKKMCIDQLEEKTVHHKEVPKEEIHLIEEPSAETQIDNQDTGRKPSEDIVAKEEVSIDDDTTSTEQQEVHMVEEEEIQKQGTNFDDNDKTPGKKIDHWEPEEKPEKNTMVKEEGNRDDGNDGRPSTGLRDVHMAEQAETSMQETPVVESAPVAEDQSSYEEEIENIEHKLSELSFQETEQMVDETSHTEANATESKEVFEQKTNSQKDSSFEEITPDANNEKVQNTTLENDNQPAQLLEVVLTAEKDADMQTEREYENLIPEIAIATAHDSTAAEAKKDIVTAPPVYSNEDTGEHISQLSEPLETRMDEKADGPPSYELDHSCNPVEEAIYSEIVTPSDTEIPPANPTVEVGSPTPPSAIPIASTSPSGKVNATPPGDMLHHIKNIQFKEKNVGIVTQNENGPCPLVAIINCLLLRRQITLPAHSEIVAAAKLMEYIGDSMLESVPKNLSGEVRLNYEQNMHDAMAVLPKLQTGLDVNVKFTGVRDFEYTPECIIFDLLRIPLFHGWLVDPQTPEVVMAVGQAGYNQLVEKVISQKCSNDENAVHEALVIENFLERSASQLTYHGLSELTTSMDDDEIGVLFRNNHFSTIYKRQKELLQLVTDQGFLGESSVVWETLGSIDGDGQFVDSHFRTVPPKSELAPSGDHASPNTSAQLTAEQQIDHDFLVALSLQEEQQQEQPAAVQEEDLEDVGEDVAKTLAENERSSQELRDLELARQLQEEERHAAETVDRETAAATSQQPPATGLGSPPPPQSSKKKDCTIL